MTDSLKLIAGLLFFSCCTLRAEQPPATVEHFNIGVYLNSLNEVVNRTDIEISLNFWAKDVFTAEARTRNFHIASSKAVLFDRIEDMKNVFEADELDLIIAPPLLIAKHFRRDHLENGFVGVLADKKQDNLVLIARTDKRIDSVKDLPGKRIGIIDNDELADVFLDTLTLKSLRQGYKEIGMTVQHQRKNNHIVLDMYFDKADAGVIYRSALDTMAELNPDIRNKIKTLAELPIKGKSFSFFRRGYPLTAELTDIAMAFKNNVRTQQILDVFKTTDLDYCRVEELNDIDALYKNYLQLKQKNR